MAELFKVTLEGDNLAGTAWNERAPWETISSRGSLGLATALRACAWCPGSPYQRQVDALLGSRYLEADFDDLLNFTGGQR